MKKVIYRGIVEFRLPDHWVEDEEDGMGLYHEHGDDTSTLRLELLVAKSPRTVGERTSTEMLLAISKGDSEIIALGNGIAGKRYEEEIDEDNQRIRIQYWYISSALKPDIGRLAMFSYTTLAINKEDAQTVQILRMLDNEILACKFADSLG